MLSLFTKIVYKNPNENYGNHMKILY